MSARRTPPDIRALALADLTAGEQPAVVAERYRLDRDLVNKWKQRYVTPNGAPLSVSVSARPSADSPLSTADVRPIIRPTVEAQQRAIGEIVLDLLRAKLEASRELARVAHDEAWRARQSASELAELGRWLDESALALGDRLAHAAGGARADADGADPSA